MIKQPLPSKRRKSRDFAPPTFVAEPNTQSNSFVGTEEYIAPVRFYFKFLPYIMLPLVALMVSFVLK